MRLIVGGDKDYVDGVKDLRDLLRAVKILMLQNQLRRSKRPAATPASPLALDLNSDGIISTTGLNSNIHFDYKGDTFKENTGWVGADDGLLVLDKNNDGKITSGNELFGNSTLLKNGTFASNGFVALAELDTNNNSKIDVGDASFSKLKVWRDLNQDGISDEGELFTLSQLEIASIGLNYSTQIDQIDSNGNRHNQIGNYTLLNGVTRNITDVWFATDLTNSLEEKLPISMEIYLLPDAKGFGKSRSLHQAMVRDTSGNLISLVEQFVSSQTRESRLDLIQRIIFAWAGQTGGERAVYTDKGALSPIDGRKISALEAFYGYKVDTPRGTGQQYAFLYESYFQNLTDTIFYQLASQTYLAPFFDKVNWTQDAATGDWLGDFKDTISYLSHYLHDHPEQAQNIGVDLIQSIRGVNPYSTKNIDTFIQQLSTFMNSSDGSFLTSNDKQMLNAVAQGSADDNVVGDSNDNTILGLAGKDTLDGGAGNDVLDGGAGDDLLMGGMGSDEYRFGVGYGHDRIINSNNNGTDVIKLTGFIYPADITLGRNGNDLWISINGTHDLLIVQDHFNSNTSAHSYIDRISFTNGAYLDIGPANFASIQPVGQSLLNEYNEIRGTTGADTLTGTAQDDVMSSGSGDDVISGLAGNDILRGEQGNDTLLGGDGQDSLYGGDGNDQLTGGSGDDLLSAGAGNDIYFYSPGDGLDLLVRQGQATDKAVIKFGVGVLPQNVRLQRIDQDLNIVITAGTDEIRIKNYFDGLTGAVINQNAVGELQFANGDVWDIEKIKTEILSHAGTSSNDTIYAFDGNDVISSGKGLDYLYGGTGNDTYQYSKGDGIDFINEAGGSDIVQLDGGITENQVNIIRDASNNLVINIQGGGSIVVNNTFVPDSLSYWLNYTIESVKFSDGSIWDLNRIIWETQKIKGGFSDDTVNGTSGDDTIVGKTGNDKLFGGAGNDYYEYSLGDGNDVVTDAAGHQDVINLGAGIDQSQVTATADSNGNLILKMPDGATITVAGEFNAWGGFTPNAIEYVRFSNSSVWGLSRIKSEVAKNAGKLFAGNTANETLIGGIGTDTLAGGKGNDQLQGGGGSDLYQYALGDGNDVITELAGTDSIQFSADITTENIKTRSDGRNLIFTMTDGATLTVKDMFAAAASQTIDPDVATIVQLMQTRWIPQAEKLIENNYGLTIGGDITLQFTHNTGGEAANVQIYTENSSKRITITANLDEFMAVPNGIGPIFYDRVMAHEMVHAAMGYNMDTSSMPGWFIEGAAEFITGADERTQIDLNNFSNQTDFNSYFKTTLGSPNTSAGYSVSYIAVKLLDKEIRNNGGSGIKELFALLKAGKTLDQSLAELGTAHVGLKSLWTNLAGFESHVKTVGYSSISTLLNLTNSDTGSVAGSDYGNPSLDAQSVMPDTDLGAPRNFNLIVSLDSISELNNIVETVKFANGAIWSVSDIKLAALKGTVSNDSIVGFDTDDVIYGDKGNDQLSGGEGNDVYKYASGDGDDTITDVSGVDRLEFGIGILASQIKATREGNNLLLTLATGGSITISNAFDSSGNFTNNMVESIVFDDKTVWDSAKIRHDVLNTNDQLIIGTDGGDNLVGGNDNDTLIGGKGLDGLHGGLGNDTYVFNVGDGTDVIYDPAGINSIVFGPGIAPKDIKIWRSEAGYEDLTIDVGSTGDRIIVDGMFDSNTGAVLVGGIQKIVFADNSSWDLVRIKQALAQGTPGADVLWGFDSNDTLSGGQGNDSLVGWAGDDTYVINLGDGKDTIIDWSGNDTIQFGAGITESQVQVGSSFIGEAEFILPNGQSVFVNHMNDTPSKAIESVRFANGVVWDSARIKSEIFKGSDKADYIYGTSGDDTLGGGKSNDELRGGLGNDTYIFNRGDGVDKITDIGGSDTLKFGVGITPSDVIVYRDSKNLYFLLKNGEMIEALGNPNGPIYDNAYAIENVIFSNGEIWNSQNIDQKVNETIVNDRVSIGRNTWDEIHLGGSAGAYINGLDGNDDISGTSGNDTLVGGADFNVLDGMSGDDTYLISQESGTSYINYSIGEKDRILFSEGINPADVGVRIYAADNFSRLDNGVTWVYSYPDEKKWTLLLSAGSTIVKINNLFDFDLNATPSTSLLNSNIVEFMDGTKWNLSQLVNKAVTGSSKDDYLAGSSLVSVMNGFEGNDNLYATGNSAHTFIGGSGNDTLSGGVNGDTYNGGADNDLLRGGSGNDTYQYNLGDGSDTITDVGGKDTISFGAGITKNDLIFTPKDKDLVISFKNGVDQIFITDWVLPGNYYKGQIETIKLYDGSSFSFDPLSNPALLVGDEFNNYLVGTNNSDTLIGHAGDDQLLGYNGDDEYRYTRGDGTDYITDFGGSDKIVFDSSILPENVKVRWEGAGTLALGIDDGSSIYLGSYTGIADSYAGRLLEPDIDKVMELVEFVGGIKWNLQDLLNKAKSPTIANDLIFGSNFADNLNGGEGSDEILSGAGNDTLSGGIGNDILRGGDGDDTYHYELGDGNDTIYDASGKDTIEFGATIKPTDLTFTRTETDLNIKIGTSTISVVDFFQGQFTSRGVGIGAIENIVFSDSTSWSTADILQRISLVGSSSNNVLFAYDSNDLSDGQGGNDSLIGGAGNDTLIGGTGNDTLVGEDGDDSLQGGDGNDYLSDTTGNNIFIGGKGDDYINVGELTGGSATIRFSLGDGVDTLYGTTKNQSHLELGAGITPDMLTIKSYFVDKSQGGWMSGYENRFDISIKGTTDKINGLFSDGSYDIKFSDSTVWNQAKIASEVTKTKANMSADRSTLAGTLAPSLTLTISYRNKDNSITTYPDITTDSAGNFSFNFGFQIRDLTRITVSAKDSSSNVLPITVFGPERDISIPPSPTAALDASGYMVNGIARPGSYVSVFVNGQAQSGMYSDIISGAYALKLYSRAVNNEEIKVIAYVQNGIESVPTILHVPDFTAPNSPSAFFNKAGTTLTGVAELNSTILVTDLANKVVGTGTADGVTGAYVVSLTQSINDGQQVNIVAKDAAGNVSNIRRIKSPDITAPKNIAATIDNAGIQVNGFADPGVVLEARDLNGVLLGYSGTATDGSFAIYLNKKIASNQTINIKGMDSNGNVSSILPLVVPAANSPAQATATISSDGKAISGIASFGNKVVILDGKNIEVGRMNVTASDGSYTFNLPRAYINNEIFGVSVLDAQNVSSSTRYVRAPDKTIPITPVAALNTYEYELSGYAEAGSAVAVKDANNNVIANAVADIQTGAFVTNVNLSNKQHIFVTSTDNSGNTSEAFELVGRDRTPLSGITASFDSLGTKVTGVTDPGVLVYIMGADGSRVLGNAITNTTDGSYSITLADSVIDGSSLTVFAVNAASNGTSTSVNSPDLTKPLPPTATLDSTGKVVTGQIEINYIDTTTVTVMDASNTTVLGSVVLPPYTSQYKITLSKALVNNEIINVTAKDSAGNVSVVTSINAPDKTAPSQPTAAFDTTGKIITGVAEVGSTVIVKNSGNTVTLGTTTANATTGAYTITLTTALINKETVNVTAKDVAGNVSTAKAIVAPDKTAPSQPTAAFDTTGKVITGVAEAGSTVEVKNSGNTATLGTATANATTGAYSITLTTALINKETVNVTAKDVAGNVSVVKAIIAPDKTAPSQPTAAFDTTGKVITGVAEAGSTVEVKNSGNTATLGTATANATTGAYSITLTTALINKETVNVTAKDVAGNVSVVKAIIAPDKTAPSQPTAAFDTTGKVITGVAEAGSTVEVKNSGNTATLGTATANATTGAYTITLTTALINSETVNVTAKDVAGNVSTAKAIVAPDKTAPSQPTAAFDTTGKVITGVAEAGSTVEVKNSGNTATLGTATANATTGAYSITLTTALINKETVNVTAKDVAGNVSVVKAIIAPDKTAPSQPTAAFDTTGKVITGVAEAGSTVEVKNSGNTATLGTATANATTGAYTITLTTALINSETVNVTAKDVAGNVSTAKAIVAPDKTAPSQPTAAFDTTGKVITGVAEAGSTVEVKNSGNTATLGTATANATTGAYSITLTTALINKETVNVTAKDVAGNVSTAKAIVAPDKTAPSQPTAAFDTTGKVITGVAEAGSTVEVKNSGNTATLGTATANATTGAYSITLTTALINKETVNVTAKDVAGNVSTAKAIVAPDKTAPSQPTAAFDTTGKVITGVAEAGSTVEVKNSGNTATLGTATANATTGAYSITLTTALINKETVNVTAKDAAGNTSPVKSIVAPLIASPLKAILFEKQSLAIGPVSSTSQLDSMIQAMAAFAPPPASESKVLVSVYDANQPLLVSHS
ncbi:Ig-like domain-containing protein [Cellvibrio sp.]|uniref:Ig-like domain-containing protein n=1 Tax=Cellvibrio sp. TaxID=1965322 RepID=UPI0039648899